MMNQIIKLALIGLALGSAVSVADDCTAPQMPTLPDGATASLEQMLAGQKAVKAYQAANSQFRTCLEPKVSAAETESVADTDNDKIQATLNKLNEDYNSSVSKEEALAESFNTALREYKEANPS
jgi:hypothetical protein